MNRGQKASVEDVKHDIGLGICAIQICHNIIS